MNQPLPGDPITMRQFAQNNARLLSTLQSNNRAQGSLPFQIPQPNEQSNSWTEQRVHEYESDDETEASDIEEPDEALSYEEIRAPSLEAEQGDSNEQTALPRRRRSGMEIQALLETLRLFQPGRGNMPMPTSNQAPRFKGRNLQRFLDDYRIATTSAGWTDAERCANLPSYCRTSIARFVRTLNPVVNRDWLATIHALRNFYPSDDSKGRFKREDIERFVKKKHRITSRREFAEYYREFCRRVQALSVPIAASDINRMFWFGLPKALRLELRIELQMRNPLMSKREAPPLGSVRKAAVELLDKESIFADSKLTRTKHRAKSNREEKTKHRRLKKSKTLFEDSDSDETDTDESDQDASDTDNSDSDNSSDSNDSDSEDSEVEHRKRRKHSSKPERKSTKKSSHREVKSKPSKHSKGTKEPADIDLGYPKGGVAELTDRIRELELMIGHAAPPVPKPKPNAIEEYTRTMNLEEEPSNSRVLNLMKLVMKELEDHRNDTQMLLDQRQPPRRDMGGPPLRCFFCRRGETHARGTINCPDAQAAVREGSCVFQNGRVYMADGSDLPKAHPGTSILDTIRSLSNTKSPVVRSSNTRIAQVTFAEAVEPDSAEYDSDDEALDASPSLWHHAMTAERTEKVPERSSPLPQKKSVSWSDEKKYQDKRVRMRPYVELPAPTRRDGRVKTVTGSNAIPIRTPANRDSVPPLKANTDNTDERVPKLPTAPPKPFKASAKPPPAIPLAAKENTPSLMRPKNEIQKSDFVIQGDPRVPFQGPERILPRSAPKAKFRSKLGNQADVGAIYKRVLGTGITLPLGDLIAVSAELGRSLADDVRVRSIPVTKATPRDEDEEMIDVFPVSHQDSDASDAESEKSGPDETHKEVDEPGMKYEDQLPRTVYVASSEPSPSPNPGAAVSSAGCFSFELGNMGRVIALVDTGAEMNVVTRDIAHDLRQHFAEDNSGRDYRLRGVSGQIHNLHAKFNDVPCALGGFTLRQTFFESDDWKSHFQVILGQPFLRAYVADMSWKNDEEKPYIEMTLYVDGYKEGRSTTVRLSKRNKKGKESVPQMAMALSSTPEQMGSENEGSETQIQEIPPYESSDSDETVTRRHEVAHVPERIRSDAETESDPEPERPWMGAIEAMRRRYRLPTTRDKGLPEMFNDAMNDLRARVRPDETQLSLEDAERLYAQKNFKTKYEIPIGNRVLTATEGIQKFKIYNRPVHAVMQSGYPFNLMTQQIQRDLGVRVTVLPTLPFEPSAEDFPTTIMYAADVPVNIGEGPFLPGFFLIVEDIAQEFDVLMGRPWLIGLEKRFKDHVFSNWSEHPNNKRLGQDGNSIILTAEDLKTAQSSANQTAPQEQSTSAPKRTTTKTNLDMGEDENNPDQGEGSSTIVRARKRRRLNRPGPLSKHPGKTGQMGSSFGRTL
jgi:hypothetical protein